VIIFKENSDGDELHVFASNETAGGGCDDFAGLSLHSSLLLTPADLNSFLLVALDPSWCGATDPTDVVRWRWTVTIEGDPRGPALSYTVA
jgi:hypothetical protein